MQKTSNTHKLESWSLKNDTGAETVFAKKTKDIVLRI